MGESATGVGEHPSPTLPKEEIELLAHALTSMSENTVLQHLRVEVASTRSPPKLYVHKKFNNAEELAAKYEAIIQEYHLQGWHIIYPKRVGGKTPGSGVGGRIWSIFRGP